MIIIIVQIAEAMANLPWATLLDNLSFKIKDFMEVAIEK